MDGERARVKPRIRGEPRTGEESEEVESEREKDPWEGARENGQKERTQKTDGEQKGGVLQAGCHVRPENTVLL